MEVIMRFFDSFLEKNVYICDRNYVGVELSYVKCNALLGRKEFK